MLIRIEGAGVCATDLHAIDGEMEPAGVTLPLVLGHENAGRVAAVGDLVSTVAVAALSLFRRSASSFESHTGLTGCGASVFV